MEIIFFLLFTINAITLYTCCVILIPQFHIVCITPLLDFWTIVILAGLPAADWKLGMAVKRGGMRRPSRAHAAEFLTSDRRTAVTSSVDVTGRSAKLAVSYDLHWNISGLLECRSAGAALRTLTAEDSPVCLCCVLAFKGKVGSL